MKKLESYLERFAQLHSDSSRSRWPVTTHYRAPHKPVILLAVMDLIAEGTVSANLIEVTPDLGELFTLYWSRVMPPDQRGNLALPFFHLKSDGFWHLMPQPGKKDIVEGSDQIKSVHRLRELIVGARLDEELYQLLQNDGSREQLRALLIEKYFSPELHPGLLEQGIINIEAYRYSQNLLEQAKSSHVRLVQYRARKQAAHHAVNRLLTRAVLYRVPILCGSI
ncbi:MAG TPA: hypothetical protein VI260_00960 [Blastocatellia bacterium]|jgi:putative restriction endonuclease